MLSGKWTYRSYENAAALVGDDCAAALAMIFGEGVMDFDATGPDSFRGGLGMSSGLALTLTGVVLRSSGASEEFALAGLGVPGTPTEGWRYDYRCSRGPAWPEAIDQVPSLVGTVVRVNPHGPDAPAGITASFVAVRQTASLASSGRVHPRNVLMAGI